LAKFTKPTIQNFLNPRFFYNLFRKFIFNL